MMPRFLEVRIVATVPLVPGDTLSDGLASVFGYRECAQGLLSPLNSFCQPDEVH